MDEGLFALDGELVEANMFALLEKKKKVEALLQKQEKKKNEDA